MALEYKGKTYLNLQEQVLKNKEDIVELIDGVSDITGAVTEEIGEVVNQVSELNQEIAKALKTPITKPIATQLVGVNNTNAQEMITLGSGLSIEDGILNTTGSGGGEVTKDKYLHIIKFYTYHEYYYDPEGYVVVALPLNTNRVFINTDDDRQQAADLANAINQSIQDGYSFGFIDNEGRNCRIVIEPGTQTTGTTIMTWFNDRDGESIDIYYIRFEDLLVL